LAGAFIAFPKPEGVCRRNSQISAFGPWHATAKTGNTSPWRDVLEECADHRIEGLLDQLLHIAEALDDHRRLLVVDMHHHRERQRRLERVPGDQRDFRKVLIQLHRADFAAHPFQDEVDGRDDLDLAGIGVERVFARQQRILPDAAAAVEDEFAVTILLARDVVGLRPGVENDDTHIADRDHRLRHGLDRRKQPVDVPGALDDDLQLPPAIAAAIEEFFRLLEIVVKGLNVPQVGPDFGRNDFA
jgi:hypothetical protein